MSLAAMGQVGATVTVSATPDLSGNLVCTGAADNVEIQAAIDHVSSLGGGELVIKDGSYVLTAGINIPASVLVSGLGNATILNFNAGGNAVTFTGDDSGIRDLKIVITAGAGGGGTRPNAIYAANRTNITISDIWIYGDRTPADDGSELRQCGIILNTCTYCKIKFCTVENFKRYGIVIPASSYNKIIGNTSKDNLQYGIRLDGSSNNKVVGNIATGNEQHGIIVHDGSNSNTVTGNTCNANLVYGIQIHSSFDNTVTGNTCNANTTYGTGIYLYEAVSNTVTGNTCNNNRQYGIMLNLSDDNTVVGNTSTGNDALASGTYDGINIEDSSRNLVCGNQCQDNGRYGIRVEGDSDYNKVSNNYTNGNASSGIRVVNATCNNNQIEFNTVEEGAPLNGGTGSRIYGNYDPSADAFVGDVGAAPW